MTERRYGPQATTLDEIDHGPYAGNYREIDLAAHIRELQAENSKIKESKDTWMACYESCNETLAIIIDECQKLKAERREFAHSCVRATRDVVTCRLIEARGRGENFWDAALSVDMLAIVEQELAK